MRSSVSITDLAAKDAAHFDADVDYYTNAEPTMSACWEWIWPIISTMDLTNVIDLACGHGRNTEMLRQHAGHVYALDISPTNIEYCKRRFAGVTNVSPTLIDGVSFHPLEDGAASLVYCFDSMVHFDSDIVRSYLVDMVRVLKVGGHAFLHHSNYTSAPNSLYQHNPHWRNFMSRELMAHYAGKAGLEIVSQQLRDWGSGPNYYPNLDCVTVLRRA